jgi:trans-aconitate methyltransferase
VAVGAQILRSVCARPRATLGLTATNTWNPELYQSSHSFVWKFGREMLSLLDPQPGERILDAGCGTGQLTAEIGNSGAQVLGIDSAPSMIEQARKNFPQLQFEEVSATDLPYSEEFDAVFSNATLHWVRDAGRAAAGIARALKPGGRFIAELGGRGNVDTLLRAVYQELELRGVHHPERLSPWYFPGIPEYGALLEQHGLEVTFAVLFDRPTVLEGGTDALKNWMAMFGASFREALAPEQRAGFLQRLEERTAHLLRPNGVWTMDYRRLRTRAVKPA